MNTEIKWQQVLEHNPQADGQFVYAVRTTGVYCRPSCPSRRPRRDSVEFFADTEQAERAGYRACLRCKPREANAQAVAVAAACKYIDAHLDERIPLEQVAQAAGLSRFYLVRLFKRLLGVTPLAYARTQRQHRLKRELTRTPRVLDAIVEAGYGSTSRVYENVHGMLGMRPSQYKNGGRGEQIKFAIVDSPLGEVLIAATERGVCSIRLGDDAVALERELREEFPAATVLRDHDALAAYAAQVVNYLGGAGPVLDLPLDVKATAFQTRVWKALQAIPYGQRLSYAEVARRIGAPTSTRAVARACALNPVALAIPCHRVVRGDGELAGYRWGVGRKRVLLEMEARKS